MQSICNPICATRAENREKFGCLNGDGFGRQSLSVLSMLMHDQAHPFAG